MTAAGCGAAPGAAPKAGGLNGALNGVVCGALLLVLAGCAASPPLPAPSPHPPPPAPALPPPPPPPPPSIYRIASGSPGVLARFPRGTPVTLQTVICLKAGEQVSIQGSNGQPVTYNRLGCLRRNAVPTRENVGGFTFGWAAPSERVSVGASK